LGLNPQTKSVFPIGLGLFWFTSGSTDQRFHLLRSQFRSCCRLRILLRPWLDTYKLCAKKIVTWLKYGFLIAFST